MSTIILCPHQDDEILSSFLLISRLRAKGEKVTVIFATNGDYHGKEEAQVRYMESVQALSLCNIDERHILYMGYGDTGMRKEHSFLYRLYHAKPNDICPSGCSCHTYHPAGLETIHHRFHNKEATYTRAHFIDDLRTVFSVINPDKLLIPSVYDVHGDHSSLASFAKEIINGQRLMTYSYLIHAGNNMVWPPRGSNSWTCPPVLPGAVWESRLLVNNEEAAISKFQAIMCFKSQDLCALDGFLPAFAKTTELFFEIIPP